MGAVRARKWVGSGCVNLSHRQQEQEWDRGLKTEISWLEKKDTETLNMSLMSHTYETLNNKANMVSCAPKLPYCTRRREMKSVWETRKWERSQDSGNIALKEKSFLPFSPKDAGNEEGTGEDPYRYRTGRPHAWGVISSQLLQTRVPFRAAE